MTYDGTYWMIDNWLNSTYSTISEANIKNSGYTTGTLITGQRFYQGYTYYSAYTQLFSGTLNSSNTSTEFSSSDYTAFLIVGADLESPTIYSTMVIPRATIGTTAKEFRFVYSNTSGNNYNGRFSVQASAATGGTITVTWLANGTIREIYGIR